MVVFSREFLSARLFEVISLCGGDDDERSDDKR